MMRRGSAVRVLTLLAAAPAAGEAFAQSPAAARAVSSAPRTPDRRPDLQGVWSFATLTPLERPKEFADKEVLTAEEAAAYVQRQIERQNRDNRNGPARQDVEGAYNNFWRDLTQVDRDDTLGLGHAVVTGPVNSSSLQVLVPKAGQFLDLVVPYPLSFFSRSAQGRIDSATSGWKGRGLWSNYSTYTPHIEDGAGPKIVKFQMRPNPLAK